MVDRGYFQPNNHVYQPMWVIPMSYLDQGVEIASLKAENLALRKLVKEEREQNAELYAISLKRIAELKHECNSLRMIAENHETIPTSWKAYPEEEDADDNQLSAN